MKVKKESEKTSLKLNIQKLRSWQPAPSLHGKQVGKQWKVTDFIFLGSKITTDGDYNDEIKMLVLWEKSYDKPKQRIKKQRHYFAKKRST